MPFARPLNFLLLCLALLLLQQVGAVGAAYEVWENMETTGRMLSAGGVVVGMAHGVLLILQMPRALRWRPRRNKRLSADVMRERRRIARDLHDRVGAQLVSALALIDPADTTHAAQRAVLEHGLLELRLVVDGMDDPAYTLADHLAQLRRRVQPVLEQKGIALEWDAYAASLPGAPRSSLFALVAQEALSNAIQYSQATQVRVSVTRSLSPASWDIEISDNGKGMPSVKAGSGGGSGLEGMHKRMRQAGGRLEVLRSPQGGTLVRAWVPDSV